MQRRHDLKFGNVTKELFSHVKVSALGCNFVDFNSVAIGHAYEFLVWVDWFSFEKIHFELAEVFAFCSELVRLMEVVLQHVIREFIVSKEIWPNRQIYMRV